MSMPPTSPQAHTDTRGPLGTAMIVLAGTPDNASGIDVLLKRLVQLAVDRVAAADYASVTALRDDAYSTVAASSDLAQAVDQAQYIDQGGPCLEALNSKAPVTVPDIATTMTWPRFRETAAGLGLHSSVSVPLFTGSGTAIAVLDLYGRDAIAMAPLIVGVWAVYDPDRPLPHEHEDLPPLDAGGEELLAGFAEALTVRATIHLALGVIRGRHHGTAKDAYLHLRLQAADTGMSLLAAASAVIVSGAPR